jgi:hypothetical protein
MKTMKQQKNIGCARFVSCVKRVWLLSISPRAARRAPASKSVSTVHSSAGCFSHEETTPGLQKIDLMRCEIFRGKVSRAKLKTKTHLETRTRLRHQTYE